MWVRGLKPYIIARGSLDRLSHPMWVRGLKLLGTPGTVKHDTVAPHVGAWIETVNRERAGTVRTSHPMWVRGLKQ